MSAVRVVVWVPVALLVAATLFMIWARWPTRSLDASVRADRVVVSKSQRTLELWSGATLLRSYKIALGRNPQGAKLQQDDGRTPEGSYRLDYHKPDSSFHKALHISYPSASDQTAARVRGVDPGGLIMVHGMKNGLGWLGRAHRIIDWTDGCVAVTDTEIDENYRAVPDETPIELKP